MGDMIFWFFLLWMQPEDAHLKLMISDARRMVRTLHQPETPDECIDTEVTDCDERSVVIRLWAGCGTRNRGLAGQYSVSLYTGEVRRALAPESVVESRSLQELTRKLLADAERVPKVSAESSQEPKPRLNAAEIRELLLVTPKVLESIETGLCPAVEVTSCTNDTIWAQVRGVCAPRLGFESGLINNYEVDILTGEIWWGDDRMNRVDSALLQEMRAEFLQRAIRRYERRIQIRE